MNFPPIKKSSKSAKSPITDNEIDNYISRSFLKSTNLGFYLNFKNIVKRITGIGIVTPKLYYENDIDFAFFERLSVDFLDTYYINDGKINSVDDTLQRHKFALSPAMNKTADIILKWVEKYTDPNKKIKISVDYGAGTGWMSLEMSKRNYGDIIATDISYDTIKHISEINPKISLIDIENFYNANLNFDFLTCIDVLEHLNNPVDVLKKIFHKANKGGVIFISVPNFKSYFSRIHLGNHPYFSYPHHLNYFTKKSLSHAVKLSGFSVISVMATTLPYEFEYVAKNFSRNFDCDTSWILWDKLMDEDLGERLFLIAEKKG